MVFRIVCCANYHLTRATKKNVIGIRWPTLGVGESPPAVGESPPAVGESPLGYSPLGLTPRWEKCCKSKICCTCKIGFFLINYIFL